MPGLLSGTLFNRLRESLGLDDRTLKLLADRTVPVLLLDDLVDPARYKPWDNRTAMGIVSHPQTAGQYGHVQLWNPPKSGVVLVLEELWARGNVRLQVLLGAFDQPLTGGASPDKKFVDRRGAGTPIAQLRFQTSATLLVTTATGGFFGTWWLSATEASEPIPIPRRGPFILPPGTGLLLEGFDGADAGLGQSLEVNFTWREVRPTAEEGSAT